MLKPLSKIACLAIVLLLSSAISARAQFEVDSKPGQGPKLDAPITQKVKVGVKVTAVGGPCQGIMATVPVPMEWPEQKVSVANEDFTPGASNITYRTLDGGVKQMIVKIASLRPGEEAHALVTFEVIRYSQLPPVDPSIFQDPEPGKGSKGMSEYLGISPFIETNHPKIRQLTKEVTEGKTGWAKVEAIYDSAREKVRYQTGPIKGAAKALTDGTGDCEELTSLFIAMCRTAGIPARAVWVQDHCYPEFYLTDGEGQGYWMPCQAAGDRSFGGIPEHRPILQKGDNFHDPDRPNLKLRYVSEYLKGTKKKGSGQPQVEFVREMVN